MIILATPETTAGKEIREVTAKNQNKNTVISISPKTKSVYLTIIKKPNDK